MADTHSAQCGELAELSRPLHAHHPPSNSTCSPKELSEPTGFLMGRLGWLNLLPLMIKQTKSPAPFPTLGVRKVN